MKKNFFYSLLFFVSLFTLVISCEEDKVNDTTNPTFIEPLLAETILVEQNVAYDLKFGYLDNENLATVTIAIEGQDPIVETVNKKEGIFSKTITFTAIGEKVMTVTLTDGNGNTFVHSTSKIKVNPTGMNWLANGELTPDADWAKFPSWTTLPAAKGDDGWAITQKNNEAESNPEYISFWSSTGNYNGAISQEITSLPNGKYILSIRYTAGRGNEESNGLYDPSTIQLKAEKNGTNVAFNLIKTAFDADGKDIFKEVSHDIEVSTGTCKVGVYIDASAAAGKANFASIDYFRLIRKK